MTKRHDDDGWRGFLELCAKINRPEELEEFLHLFLTLEEQEVLGRRYLIVKALEEGKLTQREIAEKFKVSISQITRGSNALKIIGPALKRFLESNLGN